MSEVLTAVLLSDLAFIFYLLLFPTKRLTMGRSHSLSCRFDIPNGGLNECMN